MVLQYDPDCKAGQQIYVKAITSKLTMVTIFGCRKEDKPWLIHHKSKAAFPPTRPRFNFYGAREEDVSEYQKSLEDSIKALQQRYAQPNWFNVAAGFFKPQLGGFAASLGSASEALGQNVERERESQLPIAQMRTQLALSKITMGQNRAAADMEAARIRDKLPITPEYAANLINTAPNSPQAQAIQAQLSTQQKERELASAEQSTRSAQYQQALTAVNSKWLAGGFASKSDYAKALDALEKTYGPGAGYVLPGANAKVEPGAALPVAGADAGAGAGATSPADAAAGAAGAAGAPAAKTAAGAGKNIGAQDFLTKAVYPNESPTGEPNPYSTAVGKGQMLKGTREFIHNKYSMAAGPEQYDKNPAVAAAYDYANLGHNHSLLKDPTALNHRLMWWFGTGDGPKIIESDPSKKLNEIGLSLTPDQYKINGLKSDMPVGALKAQMAGQLWKSGVDPEAQIVFGQQNASVPSAAATAAAAPKQSKFYIRLTNRCSTILTRIKRR
jgi:hypothetical protein